MIHNPVSPYEKYILLFVKNKDLYGIFIKALLIMIALNWTQFKCPSANERINYKKWKYYSVIPWRRIEQPTPVLLPGKSHG